METQERIIEFVNKFTQRVYDNYREPHKICEYLEDAFSVKGLMCCFSWIPDIDDNHYFGKLQICYIMAKPNCEYVTLTHLKAPLSDVMPLSTFINNHFNPEGLYLLEKINFDLEG